MAESARDAAAKDDDGRQARPLFEQLGETTKLDQASAEAQRALRERPSLSIRLRVISGFALCFVLSGSVILWSQWTLADIERKLRFLESAGSYLSEIEQARRNEKNFLLYGTNLTDARSHVVQGRAIIEQDADKVQAVVGRRSYQTMVLHLDQYRSLLDRLEGTAPTRRSEMEAELRSHGQIMVSTAQSLVAHERQLIDVKFRMIKRAPLVFLAILLLLVVYVAHFLNRQILAPIKRLLGYTDRIADGNLTPIMPVRKYRDEFTSLVMAMNHMMNELKRRQELLIHSHKLRAVGTLTAGIAHEINNPLNNITISGAMLKEEYVSLSDPQRLERVDEIIAQAERAERIVRNLLDFARESEAKTEHLEMRRLLDETLRLAANQLRIARVRVALEVPEGLPTIHGDRQQLHQVFLNLLLNAVDAMPDGGHLRISALSGEEPGFMTVRVADQGTGIPEHILDNIFDPFFTTKVTGKGTGLGLSVSLGIVRQHGGHLKVESKVGRGTTVTVLLPVSNIPSTISTGPEAQASPPSPPGGPASG
jgi:two-component system NtrC family sensor kinase